MESLRSYILTESVKSMAQDIVTKLNASKSKALWDNEELMQNYKMKRLDISISNADPKCLRVTAKPVSKLSSRLEGWTQFIKDIKEVGIKLNLIVTLEDQKMPKAQADICKKNGFTYQHGRKTRYELPTLTEFYYIPKN